MRKIQEGGLFKSFEVSIWSTVWSSGRKITCQVNDTDYRFRTLQITNKKVFQFEKKKLRQFLAVQQLKELELVVYL